MVSKAQVMALAAVGLQPTGLTRGDAWLNQAANLLLFGPPGGGKSHLAAALGFALVENGWRVLFTRTTDLVQRLQIARRELALEAAIAKLDKYPPADPRRPRLCHQGPSRDQCAVQADQRPLRATLAADYCQPAVWRVGQGVPRAERSHDTSFLDHLVCRRRSRSWVICSSERSICQGCPLASCRPRTSPRAR